MNVDNPEIVLDLPDHLIDFLYHEFAECKKSGSILLNTRNNLGKYIDSMWEEYQYPVKPDPVKNPVRIKLPIRSYNYSTFAFRFVHVPTYKQIMIENHLQACFELRRERFFYVGYLRGYKLNTIIEAFMKCYGIKKNSQNFDQLKKFDYRNRENLKRSVADNIQSVVIQ